MTNTLSDYNLALVLLSYIVSVIGSLAGLLTASFIRGNDGRIHLGWLLVAAILIGGCAIWAMHFLGMIAFDPSTPMAYDTPITLTSLVVPIVFVLFGLYVVTKWPEAITARVVAGAITGLGIAAMHYLGMAAVRIAAEFTYDPVLFGASIVIAIVAAIAALHIIVAFDGWIRYASALVMGVAVCGMHYTGMAALRIQAANIDVNYFDGALSERITGYAVVGVVVTACTVGVLLAGGRMLEDNRTTSRSGHFG
ncbi:MAG: MHYT domain-containing protein [Halofilum sp. (in: g-proteobacteria)]|nr:MHYT domain-containing protein [Halofilum sp. (in: g-proteobacteria)]